MPVIVAYGLPKSGSTFLCQIAWDAVALANGFSHYEAKERFFSGIEVPDYVDDLPEDLITRMIEKLPLGASYVIKTHSRPPNFLKTLIESNKVKAFVSYRDPRDIVLSMLDAGENERRLGQRRFFHAFQTVANIIDPRRFNLPAHYRDAWEWLPFRQVLQLPYYLLATSQSAAIRILCRYLGLDHFAPLLEFRYSQNKSGKIHEFYKGEADRFLTGLTASDTIKLTDRFKEQIAMTDAATAEVMNNNGYRLLWARQRGYRERYVAELRTRIP